jgi:hypothetical protein
MARMATRSFAARLRGPAIAADLADWIRNLGKTLLDPYRPELHYMRGPGPKWHAKHDPAPAALDAAPRLVRVRVKG